MGEINFFESIFKPEVKGMMDIYSVMEDIKSPRPDILEKIQEARKAKVGGSQELYEKYKLFLPCFTFNFLFKDVRKNADILSPTGLIYIDQDDSTDIDFNNEYIFATWLSVSGKGRVILVRVEGLSLDNFLVTYHHVSKLVGIDSDKHAAKASQPNIHSYDPDLYYNDDSQVYKVVDLDSKSEPEPEYWEKPLMNLVQFTNNTNKKDKVITKPNKTSNIRHNNIHEYDFDDKDYMLFEDEKELIAELYIPRKKILKGGRNSYISTITHQLIALNPDMDLEQVTLLIEGVNSNCCEPVLGRKELESIINTKWRKKLKGKIKPIRNKERRIILNPNSKLSTKQKRQLVGHINGNFRKEQSFKKFYECLGKHQVNSLRGDNLIVMKDCTGLSKTSLYKYMGMIP